MHTPSLWFDACHTALTILGQWIKCFLGPDTVFSSGYDDSPLPSSFHSLPKAYRCYIYIWKASEYAA